MDFQVFKDNFKLSIQTSNQTFQRVQKTPQALNQIYSIKSRYSLVTSSDRNSTQTFGESIKNLKHSMSIVSFV